ncbi:Glutamyl endopeptidase [Pseudocercospora fuligena]|uniref:Glutamyl endopeptidase n=1 Tax=Pseudocercospora fuligena TaxID=685502 RepID=A0A8H6VFP7_9PEZI|nr:Glutamyl endopeptidase [Pseudocercospora fuligena]
MVSRSIHTLLFMSLIVKIHGSPFQPYWQVKTSRPLGYDPDFQPDDSDDVVPDLRILDDNDLQLNETLNQSAPAAEPASWVVPIGNDQDDEEDTAIERRYIDGNDDRYLFNNNSYPFNAVGKLQWSNGEYRPTLSALVICLQDVGVFCSGALVGPRHILTAKHCIVSGATGTFSPGYDQTARDGSGRVQQIFTSNQTWGTPCGWKGDWAVMILDQRLGDKLGFFGAKLPDPSKKDKPIFRHIGYPGDKDSGTRPYRTDGNPIEGYRAWDCDGTAPYYTDTDCAGGQSGGPHWENINGRRYIWGTLSVTFDGGNGVAWAGWGSGNEMVNAIIKARRDYP